MFDKPFLTSDDKKAIVAAIKDAEMRTSGEIRVHIEKSTSDLSAVERAKAVFAKLDMQKTKDRNGVIVYIAYESKTFAIWGDEGIHQQVGDAFWQAEVNLLKDYFSKGDFTQGIIHAVKEVGERLKLNFPLQLDDKNELSNEISEG